MNARTFVLPGIAVVVALAAWWQAPARVAPGTPAATWRVGPIDDFQQARNYHELSPESPLRLSLSCGEARHLYVFSHSAEDGTLLLFPSPDLKGSPRNPLPSGRTVLPGQRDGDALAWTTRSGIRATTSYVVVASAAPLQELESLLPRLRRWSNQVMPDESMQVTRPASEVELAGAPRQGWPADVLRRAADRAVAETQVNGPLHADEVVAEVWSSSFRVRELADPASSK